MNQVLLKQSEWGQVLSEPDITEISRVRSGITMSQVLLKQIEWGQVPP